MKKFLLLFVLSSIILGSAFSQNEPSKGTFEKRVYLDGEGDIYIQKSLPLYLKFSTEPNGKNFDLKGKNPKYSEPMYLDTEGPNYIRSKWAVDPATGQTAVPQQEVLYEVMADGIAPSTSLTFKDAPKYVSGGTTYFGKNLKFSLRATDAVSGVMKTQYALGGSYSDYSSDVAASKEGAQTVYWYSADYVGNVEQTKSRAFTVDLTAPKTNYQVVGINKNGDILAPSTKLTLSASDNLSGVRTTFYGFDGKSKRAYYGPVDISGLSDGEHTFQYHSIDNVKNEEGGDNGASASIFKFYLDKIPPVPTHQVKGDQYKGQYLYISPRTNIALAATDNKAGVKNIYYRIDGGERSIYSNEFKMPDRLGTHNVKYDANDQVENLSGNFYINVFMDNLAPESGIFYGNPQFMDRDTLFINKNTSITLKTRDPHSGVQSVEYNIDGGSFGAYSQFTIPAEGYHTIQFKSKDNVNNIEQTKTSNCYVDNTAPEIFAKFSIEPIGSKSKGGKDLKVYPNYTRLYLAATDKKVGTESIMYSMDGGALTAYSSPQTLDISELSRFKKNKLYSVRVVAKDKLGNESEKTVEFFVGRD